MAIQTFDRREDKVPIHQQKYVSVPNATETVLVSYDDVENRIYGKGKRDIKIDHMHIANNSTSDAGTFDIYLKQSREGEHDLATYAQTDSVPDTVTYYYILRTTTMPIGAAIQINDTVFKDMNFSSESYGGYELCVLTSGVTLDIIINFKNR